MKNDNLDKSNSFVSVVVLARNVLGNNVEKHLLSCSNYLEKKFNDYEIVIVHERRVNNNYDWSPILTSIPSIRVIECSFELDLDVAWTVGLDNAIGDYVVLFDLQTMPLDLIDKSITTSESGIDVIVGVDENPNISIAYAFMRPLGNKLLTAIGYNIPRNATIFRCLTRQAVNIVTNAKNCHYQIYVKISQCGLPSATLCYKSLNSESNIRKRVSSSISELIELLVFNSVKPLRFVAVAGILGSLFSFAFALYSFVTKLLSEQVSDGWASIVILISLLFMLLFIILSFFAEYLARLLDDQSRNEPYWIIDEKSSSVMLNEARYNVLESPE